MPHIVIDGYTVPRIIEHIYLHADVTFSYQVFKTPLANIKLQELQEKLEAVVKDYFESYESDTYSNHEWNSRTK